MPSESEWGCASRIHSEPRSRASDDGLGGGLSDNRRIIWIEDLVISEQGHIPGCGQPRNFSADINLTRKTDNEGRTGPVVGSGCSCAKSPKLVAVGCLFKGGQLDTAASTDRRAGNI